MKYGQDLIKDLEASIMMSRKAIEDRINRIDIGMTDWEDCFVSQRCEERGIQNDQEKIDLIKRGGCEWFVEYATLDGELVDAKWCNTKYGSKLRVEMPDGSVVWTNSITAKGLAKRGLKMVYCLRPAWFAFRSSGSGMAGVYSGSYVLFPSDVNYATGEAASSDPIEIREYDDRKEVIA